MRSGIGAGAIGLHMRIRTRSDALDHHPVWKSGMSCGDAMIGGVPPSVTAIIAWKIIGATNGGKRAAAKQLSGRCPLFEKSVEQRPGLGANSAQTRQRALSPAG